MLFQFYKYIHPTHYFLLSRKHTNIFPDPESLSNAILSQLKVLPYSSEIAQKYDLSWQALQKGLVLINKPLYKIEALPLLDEYKFIRAYFKTPWVWYVLFIRLLSLKNPIKEFKAFFKSRDILKNSLYKPHIAQPAWQDLALPSNRESVTVIIPTLNRYQYLKDVLKDLEKQDYPKFEVFIVDQSDDFDKAFYDNFDLNIKLFRQEEKALWLARNTAIKESTSDYLLLFDDDSRVAPNWISNHLKGLHFYKADISSGVSISKIGDKIPEHYSFFRISDQLDTGNVLIKRSVFKKIGLFDRQFEKQRMGDGEFGARAYINGLLNISNPKAERLHLKVGSGGLREVGSWDAFRTKKWFAPRPVPSVLYFYRRYFGNKAALRSVIKNVPLSIIPYQFKSSRILKLIGFFLAIFLLPLIVFQVIMSWKLSTKKILQGSLIEALD